MFDSFVNGRRDGDRVVHGIPLIVSRVVDSSATVPIELGGVVAFTV